MQQNSLDHSTGASRFLANPQRAAWHDANLWAIRKKRDEAAQEVTNWESLRTQASNIKEHTLSGLDAYLLQFEQKAISNGVQVHWAKDSEEHNQIVHRILLSRGVKKLVKSKSMLTEECGLNGYLEKRGIHPVDTDLGEYIVQLRQEAPSHIVLPAVHLNRQEVSQTFHTHIGTEKNNQDPVYLTRAARAALRNHFVTADAAITGVNFAVAETGALVICTNEGNADLAAHAAPLHIACMGIEKIIPRQAHLSIFLSLLARSATGQAITTYSSHFLKPRRGQEMHVVLVDNGRTRQLAEPLFRHSLKCIRCGACSNTCPVYRRSGGHSYHNSIAGPIGAILAPNQDLKKNRDLPFASTLCGSCSHVCPVKINIHEQLWHWRQIVREKGQVGILKTGLMKWMGIVLSSSILYRLSGFMGRRLIKHWPRLWQQKKMNPWYRGREMPLPPRESFGSWYRKQKQDEK